MAADGSIYAAGLFAGVIDFDAGEGVSSLKSELNSSAFLLRLTRDGDFSWVRAWGEPDASTGDGWASEAFALVATTDGIVVGGQASGSLRFAAPIETGAVTTSKGFAPFLASFDAVGALRWARS